MIKASLLIIIGMFLASIGYKGGLIFIVIAGMIPLCEPPKEKLKPKPKLTKKELRLIEARRRQKLIHNAKGKK